MSKIFLSHSSANNAHALALARWLQDNGWDEYFLDVEPNRGLAPGERWQAALKQAAHRCEAVVFLISPAWRDSRWCLAEFLLAKQLGKTIFGVLVEATPLDSLPAEMTSEWQLCDLVTGTERCTFRVAHDPIVPETEVSLAEAGLARLRIGLQRAGLDPSSFPWPPSDDPKRAPYRGLNPLEAADAAVFFGRDAAIVRGLDTLRTMHEQGIERMLVILGASGSGKSSFLRAGLWPRLARDDLHFLPLPVIRPERSVLSGASGLVASLETAFGDQGTPKTRASIRAGLQAPNGLIHLLSELQMLARSRLGGVALTPTIVLAIDQGEELAGVEGREEAETFLAMLAQTLQASGAAHEAPEREWKLPLVVVTIRSDAYERLQTEPSLEGNTQRLFDLPPVSPKQFKAVIEGPAARATAAGHKLVIDPALTEQLLRDAEGADALPLLAFTLERLYFEHGADGDLRLDEYEALGGVRGSIEAAVEVAFAEPGRQPVVPANKAERTALLHKAFVPWLAIVDPQTNERRRRVARWDELPADTHPLLERLIEARLLLRDRRKLENDAQEIEEVVAVEVTHEALLRQWNTLTEWLDADASKLKMLDGVQRAASEWIKNGRRETWLVHAGERLTAAEQIRTRTDFDRLLGSNGAAYLEACRERESQVQSALKGTPEYDLKRLTQGWKERKGLMRLFGLAGWWKLLRFRGLAIQGSLESAYLRWSATRASVNALVLVLLSAAIFNILSESAKWAEQNGLPFGYTFIKPLWMLGYMPKPRMVEIPPGKFTMGCVAGRDDIDGECPDEETPAREVTISQPFRMGKYEVTFLEYDSYVWRVQRNDKDKTEMQYPEDGGWGRFDRPVINISWQDAKAYAQWLGEETGRTCRLPSEAEWEYAARSGTGKKYGVPAPDGIDAIAGKRLANCSGCGSKRDWEKTAPVGSFPVNRFGLHDMSGNVWEWAEDEYQPYYPEGSTTAEALKVVVGEGFARVLRGGSWYNDPIFVRSAARNGHHPVGHFNYIGFRVLCSSSID